MNVEGLRQRDVSAVVNCALESCLAEVACFRQPVRGRPRSHTRGLSLQSETEPTPHRPMCRDQVWAVTTFDAEWYSQVLDCEVVYHTMAAADEEGYAISAHFAEVTPFIQECRQHGRKVLVHCVMGINRAPTMVVAYLCG